MSDELLPQSSASRSKPPRTGLVTGGIRPRSPTAPGETNGDARPQKRARKAINCEPCRNSKLKCDRNRPCSSCVLRGTAAQCYADGRSGPEQQRVEEVHPTHPRVDPAQEFARIRQSINLLETYVYPTSRPPPTSTPRRIPDTAPLLPYHHPPPKREPTDANGIDSIPGMLASVGHGGLYAGPTSTALHLLGAGKADIDGAGGYATPPEDYSSPPEYDKDLLALLPSLETIDNLIAFYFDSCNWIHRHVNQVGFLAIWDRFKKGHTADRIVLATACVIMAVAVHYLPMSHPIHANLEESYEAQGNKFFEVSQAALRRRQEETKKYSVELVELLLIQSHYLSLAKSDTELVWQLRGELVSIATALGLHRDPGKFNMSRDVAERRRWAWWHVVLLERWQAFMFGRPLSIASHHFDTQYPEYCNPNVDKTGRLYLPNIAMFKLAYILGEIMDDAVSVRPVPYERVESHDHELLEWMRELPVELDLDDFKVARNLASSDTAMRRQGVQSIIIRTSFYHIRFTLHRPYAANAHAASSGIPLSGDGQISTESLDIAVSAADKLINMVGQSRPDFLANSSLAVPGHMSWGPFHCFSAAMFFSFQLISDPEQPGAGLFRASVRKAMSTLEQARETVSVADKGYQILHALTPLYSGELSHLPMEEKAKRRQQVFALVRTLALPYHDSGFPRRSGDSPSASTLSPAIPTGSGSVQQPSQQLSQGVASSSRSYDTLSQITPSMLSSPQHNVYEQNMSAAGQSGTNIGNIGQSPLLHLSSSSPVVSTHNNHMSTPAMSTPNGYGPDVSSYMQPPSMYSENARYAGPAYGSAGTDDPTSAWGAAVGFGHEWTQFLEATAGRQGLPHGHPQGG
ncbi:hypothetical protein CYLTODRAFT_418491 [Cylindrobasidium torrendii FP15055 ss-10]|uniref:Zn(2)-C6 fungal-type domain-containing protein n=1 Tax=Cylindrobasidium torrendii FP15055 ss-10 TaxID=1314674 RepID=A0A0D7BMU5_9AGAR|nr:hypothetical protein CYLTODRAFT_418491 [Cylindrobasidium torrendii FP15055 ss-10]